MNLPARAAAIRGDTFQHALGWWRACVALRDEDVVSVSIEDPSSGAFDDVVVRRTSGSTEYWQAKSSNSGSVVIDETWLCTPSTAAGKSPLKHFYDTWQRLATEGQPLELTLASNRAFDHNSKILGLRDLLTERIVRDGLLAGGSRSDLGKERKRWAAHLQVSEEQLADFLSQLRLYSVSEPALRDLAKGEMAQVGLRPDDEAVTLGIAMVAGWVMRGDGSQSRSAIREQVAAANLLARPGVLQFRVHAIDRSPWADPATVELDIVDWYDGDDPRQRYRLQNHGWNDDVLPELKRRVRDLEQFGPKRVLVSGNMRLPLWFSVGFLLPDIRGWVVSTTQRETEWASSDAPTTPPTVVADSSPVAAGTDLAVAINLTADITHPVEHYLTASGLPVPALLTLTTSSGPGHQSIPDGAFAAGWARGARDRIAAAVREHRATQVHLFFAAPAGAALLLGHSWNTLPPTTLYEYVPAEAAYYPTMTLP